jgi:cysteinyl-tRNA synthetase
LKAGNTDDFDVAGLKAKCLAAMDDDINTPIAISHLFEGVKWVNAMVAGKASLSEAKLKELQDLFNLMVHQILGLERETLATTDNSETDALMDLVLKLRGNAKDHKDWGTADTIRDHLKEIGIQIKDSKEGSSWEYEK